MNTYRNKTYSNAPVKSIEKKNIEKQNKKAVAHIFVFLCLAVGITFLLAYPFGDLLSKNYSQEKGFVAAMAVLKENIEDTEAEADSLQEPIVSEKDMYDDFMSEEDIMAAALDYIDAHRPKYVFPLDGYITSAFANRTDPILGDREEYHTGIDISAATDVEICAYADGMIKKAVVSDVGYGNHLIIEHDGFETLYAHCSELLVKEGDTVKAGETIAIAGNTGRSTGTHLHFEIRIDGIPVDPLEYIEENEAKKYA